MDVVGNGLQRSDVRNADECDDDGCDVYSTGSGAESGDSDTDGKVDRGWNESRNSDDYSDGGDSGVGIAGNGVGERYQDAAVYGDGNE